MLLCEVSKCIFFISDIVVLLFLVDVMFEILFCIYEEVDMRFILYVFECV